MIVQPPSNANEKKMLALKDAIEFEKDMRRSDMRRSDMKINTDAKSLFSTRPIHLEVMAL
jgi:hypothetical protein